MKKELERIKFSYGGKKRSRRINEVNLERIANALERIVESLENLEHDVKRQGADKMDAYEQFGEDLQELYLTAIGAQKRKG